LNDICNSGFSVLLFIRVHMTGPPPLQSVPVPDT
jgi:hypothetical protein